MSRQERLANLSCRESRTSAKRLTRRDRVAVHGERAVISRGNLPAGVQLVTDGHRRLDEPVGGKPVQARLDVDVTRRLPSARTRAASAIEHENDFSAWPAV